ncbi:coiled-coil domain-containing protein 201 [Peromyscus californicus insignis]|uniref:coiled-coil domain-containing protein 201 n=1 Tax=Peromyscus californicus insignis TaxID=564181 RepID=UPI0022A6B0C8|nr:coiled-coil domain-containing protein 201 [Peromyscus californicus insignis]
MHSTPQEMAMGWSPRPPRRNFQSNWSLTSEDSFQDPVSQLEGFSPTATFRKKRLSTVEDFESSSGQVEPYSDHLAAEEEPCMSASLNKEERPKIEALQAVNWPRNSGMPGISDTAWQRRRDPKKRAAAMQRLRQWEAQQLQEIEEAVHHELTIQEEVLSTELPDQAQGPLSFSTVRVDAQDPAALA